VKGSAIMLWMAAALALSASGCDSGLVPVHGTVHWDGGELSGARVLFAPIGGGGYAYGEIQDDGGFQLTSEHPDDGAAPGQYRIRVIQTKVSETGKLYTTFVAPRDKPLEVVPGKTNEFAIEVREQDGWQIKEDK
jgi:hypothetical protein